MWKLIKKLPEGYTKVTRDGRPARILGTDILHEKPVVAAVLTEYMRDAWYLPKTPVERVFQYRRDLSFKDNEEHRRDLLELEEYNKLAEEHIQSYHKGVYL